MFYARTLESPIGLLQLLARDDALCRVAFAGKHLQNTAQGEDALLTEAARQLRAYFDGALRDFDLPLAPAGTDFQRQVWQALAAIPWGQTVSYAELAARIGRPRAVRAVGAANGANPLPIVLPCHRVIGRDGSLTGYAGGLEIKRQLLALEAQGEVFELAMPAGAQRS